jgi:hypothetical protein|tara:strand:- start:226 stop:435 length:210 start_codon:yes stop_codon:yes gene_type:complete
MTFSIMLWQKPGLAWVKLDGDKQWRLAARADFDPETYLEFSRLSGKLRASNYEKKELDSLLKKAYNLYS